MRALLPVLILAACAPPPPPAYTTHTKAIFDTKCTGCHKPNGIGPMPLTTYAEVKASADIVLPAIDSGRMPPWKAAPGCNSYSNDFSLTAEEKATVDAWFAAGMPEGDAPSKAEGALHDPGLPPIRYDEIFDAAPEPYLPPADETYRCFAIAWPYSDAKYITGFDMIPGDPTNVHHVNIFLNPPSPQADFVAIDAADPAPGFDCGNGDRILQSALIGAWAPGASGQLYPDDTGQLVEPGSSITLEVHYAHQGLAPDASKLALQTADTVARRGLGAAFWWFNNWDNGGMDIPAGQTTTHDVEMDPALVLAAVAPWITTRNLELYVAAVHMHGLGAHGELAVHSPVGDTCLVNVPRWDQHWQMGYVLTQPVPLFLGEDKLYLSCTWDNQTAVDVNWGPRTVDEMCIGFVYLVPG